MEPCHSLSDTARTTGRAVERVARADGAGLSRRAPPIPFTTGSVRRAGRRPRRIAGTERSPQRYSGRPAIPVNGVDIAAGGPDAGSAPEFRTGATGLWRHREGRLPFYPGEPRTPARTHIGDRPSGMGAEPGRDRSGPARTPVDRRPMRGVTIPHR